VLKEFMTMRIRFAIACALLPALLGGCIWSRGRYIVGSGQLIETEQTVSGFRELDIGGAFGVVVRQAENFRVAVRADDNVIEFVRCELVGDRLVIGMDGDRSYRDATMAAEIALPVLSALEVSGASRVVLEGFESVDDLAIELSGVSAVDGDVRVGALNASLSGSSRIMLSGGAERVRLRSSGSIRVDLSEFSVVNADIDVSGSSRVVVDVSGALVAKASGASTIRYLEEPESVERETSGAGRIGPLL
jgi:hypothetical protein